MKFHKVMSYRVTSRVVPKYVPQYLYIIGKIFSRTADWKKSKFTWNLECVSWTIDLCISFTVHVSISYCHITRSKTNKSNHLIHVFKTFGYMHFSLSTCVCIYMYITFILLQYGFCTSGTGEEEILEHALDILEIQLFIRY